jgi:hypothetical protein
VGKEELEIYEGREEEVKAFEEIEDVEEVAVEVVVVVVVEVAVEVVTKRYLQKTLMLSWRSIMQRPCN